MRSVSRTIIQCARGIVQTLNKRFKMASRTESIKDLCTPAFVVDLDIVRRNSDAMQDRFRKLGVQLRPHMKTHKTL
ncbi:D-threo-3-hydroxyaspartate dehydratase [Ictalurus punctatus]|nr:D-threo-3-hydroxyaspartate dehydratase [Ictalurus punctatus]